MSRLTIIVAATKSNGIGHNGRLPWRLSQDMAYFKAVTAAPTNAVIMGRKTWESIPTTRRPLVNRINLVISRNPDYKLLPPSTTLAYLHTDLQSAIARFSSTDDIRRAFIIGGASIYRDTLALPPLAGTTFVDRVLLTRILSPAFDECDVFMPNFQSDTTEVDGVRYGWTRAAHADLQTWVGFEVPEGVQKQNEIEFEFQMWVRGRV